MLSFPTLLGAGSSVLDRAKREIFESVTKLLSPFSSLRLLPLNGLIVFVAAMQEGDEAIEPVRLNLIATAKGFDVLGQIPGRGPTLRVEGKRGTFNAPGKGVPCSSVI